MKGVSTGWPGVASGMAETIVTGCPPDAKRTAPKIPMAKAPLKTESIIHVRPPIDFEIGRRSLCTPWGQGDACSLDPCDDVPVGDPALADCVGGPAAADCAERSFWTVGAYADVPPVLVADPAARYGSCP